MTWEADQLSRIDEVGWLPPGSRLLLAVSGGSDSMAMLHLLSAGAGKRKWEIGVAHLDHGLRGSESRQDAAFVRRAAKAYGWPAHIRRQDVEALACERGESVEMTARGCRHDWFESLAKRHHYTHWVLAHTRDDQAETLLLRLLRGAGIEGLQAMAPVSQLRHQWVVRPFLDCPKEQLQEYLKERQLSWREDISNADWGYARNRVRHQLVPLLQSYNPRIQETLARTAQLLRQDYGIISDTVTADFKACLPAKAPPHKQNQAALNLRAWRQLPQARQRHVIHRWLLSCLNPEDVTFDAVQRVQHLCRATKGTQRVSLPGNQVALREYDLLLFLSEPHPQSVDIETILEAGNTDAKEWGVQIQITTARGYQQVREAGIANYPAEAYISAAIVPEGSLRIRSWQPGDRMIPYGCQGSRKVQDIFTDAKIPGPQRHSIPLFVSQGRIVWIPGYRIAAHVAVESATAPSYHIRVRRMSA